MEHILVLTDFSDCAEDALRVGAKYARMSGATLHVAHVYYNIQPSLIYGIEEDDGSVTERYRDNIQAQLDILISTPDLEGVQVKKHCIMNKPIWDIMDLGTLSNMELLIMGSHGSSGVREFFIGSNAQKVVQSASCPVLVVKQYFDLDRITNVVFASNFRDNAIGSFAPIKELIDLLGARTHLLKVITPGTFEGTSDSFNSMDEFAKMSELEDHTMNTYNAFSIDDGILSFVKERSADLVCIETHGRAGLGHWLTGSIAERVVNHANVPVLTMKIMGSEMEQSGAEVFNGTN